MKRSLLPGLMLALAATLMCAPGLALAADWETGDFTYTESDSGITVTGLTEDGQAKLKENSNLVIPDQIEGLDVVAIGDGASATQGVFKFTVEGVSFEPSSVKLPSKLETIGKYAFSATTISEIDFPSTLKVIGQQAFAGSSLTSVILPEGLTTMGMQAFQNSRSIANVYVPSTLIPDARNTNGAAAFMRTPIQSTDIPMEKAVIAEGATVIPNSMFNGCQLREVSLPDTLETIGTTAFTLNQLTTLEIPGKVKSIPANAFSQATLPATLKNLTLNEGLEAIGMNAFRNANLESVKLPESVTTLNNAAFNENNNDRDDNSVILYSSVPDQARGAGAYTKVVVEGARHTVYYPFTVTFDANGGTVDTASATINTSKKLEALPTPTKDGCEFVGWFTEDGTKITADSKYSNDTTITAKWLTIIDSATVTAEDATYADAPIVPKITVALGEATLVKDTDYTVELEGDLENVGQVGITVSGIGDYTGTATGTLTIAPAEITGATAEDVVYTGKALKPAVTVKAGKLDVPADAYTVEYADNTEVGTGKAIVTAKEGGNFTGTATAEFTIGKAKQAISASDKTVTYNKTVALGAKLTAGVGALSYKSSDTKIATVDAKGVVKGVKAGTAKITITAAADGAYLETTKTVTVTVKAAANPLTVKAKTATVKYAKVKKKAQTLKVAKVLTVSKAQGKVTYKKLSGNKKITVAANGKVTVKKGLKKATYKVKVRVSAAGKSGQYAKASKTVTFKVKVK